MPLYSPGTQALKHTSFPPYHSALALQRQAGPTQPTREEAAGLVCIPVPPSALRGRAGESWHSILLQLQGCARASSILSSPGLMSSLPFAVLCGLCSISATGSFLF